jgi:archaellum component FlaC
MKAQIELLEENIKRLEFQILSAFTFQKGYIDNCKSAIESYKKQIEKLKTIN